MGRTAFRDGGKWHGTNASLVLQDYLEWQFSTMASDEEALCKIFWWRHGRGSVASLQCSWRSVAVRQYNKAVAWNKCGPCVDMEHSNRTYLLSGYFRSMLANESWPTALDKPRRYGYDRDT